MWFRQSGCWARCGCALPASAPRPEYAGHRSRERWVPCLAGEEGWACAGSRVQQHTARGERPAPCAAVSARGRRCRWRGGNSVLWPRGQHTACPGARARQCAAMPRERVVSRMLWLSGLRAGPSSRSTRPSLAETGLAHSGASGGRITWGTSYTSPGGAGAPLGQHTARGAPKPNGTDISRERVGFCEWGLGRAVCGPAIRQRTAHFGAQPGHARLLLARGEGTARGAAAGRVRGPGPEAHRPPNGR